MRKVFSILLIVMILFSGITINLASHYCGGAVIGTKLSFSGDLAGCGMEHSQSSSGISLSNNCCDDVKEEYTLNNTYVASSFQLNDLHLFSFLITYMKDQAEAAKKASSFLSEIYTRPPGAYIPNEVDRELICIFRI